MEGNTPQPAAQPAPAALDRDKLTEVIAEAMEGAMICDRAWSAWGHGTMSERDFSPANEGDMPGDVADAVLKLLEAEKSAAPAPDFERMFYAACEAQGEVDNALGLPQDGCNNPEATLARIERVKEFMAADPAALLRRNVRAMATMLDNREWAGVITSDPDADALESAISDLHGEHSAMSELLAGMGWAVVDGEWKGPAPAVQRPECFDFAMDFLGDPEAPLVIEYVEKLEKAVAGSGAAAAPAAAQATLSEADVLALLALADNMVKAAVGMSRPSESLRVEGRRRALERALQMYARPNEKGLLDVARKVAEINAQGLGLIATPQVTQAWSNVLGAAQPLGDLLAGFQIADGGGEGEQNRWLVKRAMAPYGTSKGIQCWGGPTPEAALQAASEALGLAASQAPAAAQPDMPGVVATRYTLPDDSFIEYVLTRDGAERWAVRNGMGDCLGRGGEWEWEPRPSGRSDEFLQRCRFASVAEAYQAWTKRGAAGDALGEAVKSVRQQPTGGAS